MTREEAIEILWQYDVNFEPHPAEKVMHAIDMAIEALQREEAEEKGYCHRIKPKEYFSADADRPKVIGIDYSPYRIQTTAPSAEQVTSKLNNPCNSLLTDESNGSKEHKSKLDLISRADAIKAVAEHFSFDDGCSNIYKDIDYYKGIAEHILKNVPSALPSADYCAWGERREP